MQLIGHDLKRHRCGNISAALKVLMSTVASIICTNSSDPMKLFSLNAKRSHVWKKPQTAQYHPYSEAWWCQHCCCRDVLPAASDSMV